MVLVFPSITESEFISAIALFDVPSLNLLTIETPVVFDTPFESTPENVTSFVFAAVEFKFNGAFAVTPLEVVTNREFVPWFIVTPVPEIVSALVPLLIDAAVIPFVPASIAPHIKLFVPAFRVFLTVTYVSLSSNWFAVDCVEKRIVAPTACVVMDISLPLFRIDIMPDVQSTLGVRTPRDEHSTLPVNVFVVVAVAFTFEHVKVPHVIAFAPHDIVPLDCNAAQLIEPEAEIEPEAAIVLHVSAPIVNARDAA